MPAMAMMLGPSGGIGGGGGGAGFVRSITIDHTKVGASDHTNAVALVSGTYSYLATVANSGKATNANGYDVGFYSDALCTTKLKWEIERYVAATGEVVYWVKIPSVSHTVDTVFYMGYGIGSITTDQSDKANVWDTYDSLVLHMGDGTTLSTADSTSHANTTTAINGPTAATGKIAGTVALLATSQRYLSVATATPLQMTNLFTLSAWVYPTSFSDYRMIICKGNTSGGLRDYDIDIEQSSGKLRFYFTQGSGNYQGFTGTTALTLNTWQFVTATYDGTTMRLYLNATACGTRSQTGNVEVTTDIVAIGRVGALAGNYFDGSLDEARIAKGIARSADWVTFQYNNQNSPSTFYTVGSEASL